jgi:hypothetical protein
MSDRAISEGDKARIMPLLFSESKPRLDLVMAGASFKSYMKAEPFGAREHSSGDMKFREAVQAVETRLRDWPDDKRRALLSYILDHTHVVLTIVHDKTLAYQMFISANTRGLRLNIGDMVKGAIADRLLQLGAPAQKIDACMETYRSAQRRLRTNFSDVLYCVEELEFVQPPADEAIPGELLLQWLNYADTSVDEISDWLNGPLQSFTHHLSAARKSLTKDDLSGPDLVLRRLFFIPWSDWQPFFVRMASHSERFWQYPLLRLQALERACFLMILLRWQKRSIIRHFREATLIVENGGDPFSPGEPLSFKPNVIRTARDALRSQLDDPRSRAAMVKLVETILWHGTVPRNALRNCNVEHVLPRQAYGEWDRSFTTDEKRETLHLLGNLCLIPEKINIEVENKAWSVKRKAFQSRCRQSKTAQRVLAVSDATSDGPSDWNPATIRSLTEEYAVLVERELDLTV